jgi:hypothetical protein
MRENQAYDAAMHHYLSQPMRAISESGHYPSRDEIHDRASLR